MSNLHTEIELILDDAKAAIRRLIAEMAGPHTATGHPAAPAQDSGPEPAVSEPPAPEPEPAPVEPASAPPPAPETSPAPQDGQ